MVTPLNSTLYLPQIQTSPQYIWRVGVFHAPKAVKAIPEAGVLENSRHIPSYQTTIAQFSSEPF